MKRLFVVTALLFFPPTMGYGTEKTASFVDASRIDDRGNLTFEMRVFDAPAAVSSAVVQDALQQSRERGRVESTPASLWMLVDTAQLCTISKLDKTLPELIARMKSTLHSHTQLSLVSYSSQGLEMITQNTRLASLDGMPLRCETAGVSMSFEKPLQRLLDAPQSSLPVRVWVFSSGNITLSKEMQRKLSEKKIRVTIFLYNPALERELRPFLDSYPLAAEGLLALRPYVAGKATVPEQWFTVTARAPSRLAGKITSFRVEARGEGFEAMATSASLVLTANTVSILDRVTFIGLILAAFLFTAFVIYRTVCYFRPRSCAGCKRRLRFGQKICFFCEREKGLFLIGSLRGIDRRREGAIEVVPFQTDRLDLGSHRRSAIPLPRVKGKGRRKYLSLLCDRVASGANRVRAVPSDTSIPIFVNGRRLVESRDLAIGDRLQIGPVELTLYQRREHETRM